jgi:hypothetical protein
MNEIKMVVFKEKRKKTNCICIVVIPLFL